jgi:hypothetical protein
MMRFRLLFTACALAGAGCASGGQGGDIDRITVTVRNEYPSTVTAYAVWDGRRTRLGELRRNRTRTFATPRRGDRIALGLEVIASPPPGTTAGPTRFRGGAGADPSTPFIQSEAIEVAAGEGIEWRLESSGALLFRRSSEEGAPSPVVPSQGQ